VYRMLMYVIYDVLYGDLCLLCVMCVCRMCACMCMGLVYV
jgi:hypothetical protein